MDSPVVFLAFSNDADAHLELLKAESKEVFRALRELDRQEFVKVHREESADIEEIFETLLSFNDRVAVFHYGGHADGSTLQLEGGAGHAAGLAGLLGEQANLKLVFLNGCATRPQVDGLMTAGVKAVIATSVPVCDDHAKEFAVRFYQALASGRTIGQAFRLARAYLETRHGHVREIEIIRPRNVRQVASPDAGKSVPWGLFVNEKHENEVLNWKLPWYRAVGLPQDMIQYIDSSLTANRYVIRVLDEMARYNPDIHVQMLEQRGAVSVKRDSREFPELIIRNLPWPLGSQIRLLRQHESPGAERLEHLLSAYVRTSQLLYYILLSDLWEQVRRGTIDVPTSFNAVLPEDKHAFASFDFLAKTVELYRLFTEQGAAPWVPEYEKVLEAWDEGSEPLQKARAWMERQRATAAASSASELEQQCLSAEQALSVVLRAAAFLARYRMLTVRNIAVEAPRFEAVSYELNMGPLNASENGALYLYQDAVHRRKARYGNSHSIVLVRDEDILDDGLNLSPFVVDKNTFVSVMNSDAVASNRLADVFLFSYPEENRLVYLAVDHSIPFALENERDRIHTDMTREDFAEGRNVTQPTGFDDSGLGGLFQLDRASPAGAGEPVFRVLRDQFDALMTDLGMT